EVFICPNCLNELVFWDTAVEDSTTVLREFNCEHCNVNLNKRELNKAYTPFYDKTLQKTVKIMKKKPVLINYSVGNKRYEKRPDKIDLQQIDLIREKEYEHPLPTNDIPLGEKTNELHNKGISYVHHFYTKRNIIALSALFSKFKKHKKLLFLFTSTIV